MTINIQEQKGLEMRTILSLVKLHPAKVVKMAKRAKKEKKARNEQDLKGVTSSSQPTLIRVGASTASATLIGFSLFVSGCATRIPEPPKGQPTVSEAYSSALSDDDYAMHETNGSPALAGNAQNNSHKRIRLSTGYRVDVPSMAGALQNPELLKEQARDNQNFPMLPNPQVMVYIYPHVTDGLPIHGNWSTFSLYANNHYALPSEVNTGGNSNVE